MISLFFLRTKEYFDDYNTALIAMGQQRNRLLNDWGYKLVREGMVGKDKFAWYESSKGVLCLQKMTVLSDDSPVAA